MTFPFVHLERRQSCKDWVTANTHAMILAIDDFELEIPWYLRVIGILASDHLYFSYLFLERLTAWIAILLNVSLPLQGTHLSLLVSTMCMLPTPVYIPWIKWGQNGVAIINLTNYTVWYLCIQLVWWLLELVKLIFCSIVVHLHMKLQLISIVHLEITLRAFWILDGLTRNFWHGSALIKVRMCQRMPLNNDPN